MNELLPTASVESIFDDMIISGDLQVNSNAVISNNDVGTFNVTDSSLNTIFNVDTVSDIVTITGSLNVLGNITQVTLNDIIVSDPLIKLGDNNAGDTYDIGFYGQYVSSGTKYAGLVRKAGSDFSLFSGLTSAPTATSVGTVSSLLANLNVNNLNVNNITTSQTGALILTDSVDGSNTTSIKAGNQSGNLTLTLPVNAGSASQFLQTDGSGVLSWATAAGGGSSETLSGSSTLDITKSISIINEFPLGPVEWVAYCTPQDTGRACAVGACNNFIILTGMYAGTNTTMTFYNNGGASGGTLPASTTQYQYVVKYNNSGIVQWLTRIGIASGIVYPNANIYIDSTSNNIYVCAFSSANAIVTIYDSDAVARLNTISADPNFSAFLVKYNSSGMGQWRVRTTGTLSEYPNGAVTDSSDNVYLSFSYSSGPISIYSSNDVLFNTYALTGSDDGLVVKYNSSGTVQWVFKIASTAWESVQAIDKNTTGLAVLFGYASGATVTLYNSDASPYGTTYTSVGNRDIGIAKYSYAGFVQWSARAATVSTKEMRAVSVRSNDNYHYILFNSNGNVNVYHTNGVLFKTLIQSSNYDVGIIIYDNSGTCYDAYMVATAANNEENGNIDIDASGIYISFTSSGGSTVTFYNSDGSTFSTLASSGVKDVMYCKYSFQGNCLWRTKISGSSNEDNPRISVNNSGVYCSGASASNPITAYNSDNTAFATTIPGSQSGFLVKYSGLSTLAVGDTITTKMISTAISQGVLGKVNVASLKYNNVSKSSLVFSSDNATVTLLWNGSAWVITSIDAAVTVV